MAEMGGGVGKLRQRRPAQHQHVQAALRQRPDGPVGTSVERRGSEALPERDRSQSAAEVRRQTQARPVAEVGAVQEREKLPIGAEESPEALRAEPLVERRPRARARLVEAGSQQQRLLDGGQQGREGAGESPVHAGLDTSSPRQIAPPKNPIPGQRGRYRRLTPLLRPVHRETPRDDDGCRPQAAGPPRHRRVPHPSDVRARAPVPAARRRPLSVLRGRRTRAGSKRKRDCCPGRARLVGALGATLARRLHRVDAPTGRPPLLRAAVARRTGDPGRVGAGVRSRCGHRRRTVVPRPSRATLAERGAHVVLDAADVEGPLHEDLAVASRGGERIVRTALARHVDEIERSAVAFVQQIWVCSEHDASIMRARYPQCAHVVVVPNTVDTAPLRRPPALPRPGRLPSSTRRRSPTHRTTPRPSR